MRLFTYKYFLMKKFVPFLLGLIFLTTITEAQYITVPDSNFAKKLLQLYPFCITYVDYIHDPLNQGYYLLDTTCTVIRTEDSLNIRASKINDLTGIEYFKSLIYLNLDSNGLTASPPLSNTLKTLIITNYLYGDSPFGYIPPLPNSLTYLDCSDGGMLFGNFPYSLPASLKYLSCANTGLYQLPLLPDSLIYLDCSSQFNYTLTSAPPSLMALPQLPKSLKYLNCSVNKLSSLPSLPDSLTTLNASDMGDHDINWNFTYTLFCLPKLPNTLTSLSIPVSVTCLPNIPPGISSNLPVCNPTNDSNHCQGFPTVSGYIFTDNNSNGVKDANELYKSNVKLQLTDGVHTKYTFTNNSGYYEISADSLGAYTLSVNAPVYYKAVPASINYSFGRYDTSVSQQNIVLQPTVNIDSLNVLITPYNVAKPGFDIAYQVKYSNAGTTSLSSDIVINYNNTLLNYVSSGNPSVINNGTNLSLSGVNLMPGESGTFDVNFIVNPADIPGNIIVTDAAITAGSAKDVDTSVSLIKGAYDPNDIQATSLLTPLDVINDKSVDYTIRFQNTGNAPANNIVISDTLSELLDANSVQVIASSYPCKVTIEGNIIFFEFMNILLPDSNENELGSHGFVSFSVKPQSSLNNTSINNKASIYFDYNSPISTNTAVTLIKDTSSTVLPLKIISFKAITQTDNNATLLNWSTANEVNTKFFIVEKSIDGINFTSIATLAAKGSGEYNYSYNVSENASVIYYRLKLVDADGKYTYSDIVKVKNDQNVRSIIILNNPAQTFINIRTYAASLNNTIARIFNSQGGLMKSFVLHTGTQSIDISKLSSGSYYIRTQLTSLKLIVSR